MKLTLKNGVRKSVNVGQQLAGTRGNKLELDYYDLRKLNDMGQVKPEKLAEYIAELSKRVVPDYQE